MAESEFPNGTVENETFGEKPHKRCKVDDGCTPIVDAGILISKNVLFVKHLKLDLVLPGLKNLLSVNEKDELDSKINRGWKTASLIDYLVRKTSSNRYETFNAFIKILAGVQPELFTEVVGRNPTLAETDFCIQNATNCLRKDVLGKGHCIDSQLDEEVDFNKEHVQLKIRKIDNVCTNDSTRTGRFPHEYQAHLEEHKGEQGTVCDNLDPEVNRRTVIQGRAGIGKSTTMQWLGNQWAISRWAMGFPVLFLIQLRQLSNTNRTMTAVELLTLYGLYQVGGVDMTVFAAWMANSANRILLLIDGLDEISGFSERLKNAPKISDINQKASPLDLCINILRGDLLPKCCLISTSRPFTGLNELKTNNTLEILGLTKDRVNEYVQKKHPQKAEHIMSVLSKAPLLMSLCSITVYCMIISTLLNEGVELLDEDVQTYTRLTAFILVRYASRKLTKWPFVIEVNSYFSKLTQLAYKGIFASNEEMPKLVFNEYDLAQAQLTPADLDAIQKVGILEMTEKEIGQRKTMNAEFIHTSIQEMLAISHFVSGMSKGDFTNMEESLLSGGQLDMAQLYLYGLTFDHKSMWIKDVLSASGHTLKFQSGSELLKFMNTLMFQKDKDPHAKLMLCQLVHETQDPDHAKLVQENIATNGELVMLLAPMTVLDLNAVHFVCQHVESLTKIQFNHVNADDTFIKVLSSTLLKKHATTLKILDVAHNNIGADGVRSLAECIGQNTIHTLNLSHNLLGVEGGKAVSEILQCTENLKTLDISFCNIQAGGMKAISAALQGTNKLTGLHLGTNNLGVAGAEAVAGMLCNNRSITDIALSGNHLGSEGTKSIAGAVGVNSTIKVLGLQDNNIGYEGAQYIEEMLKLNKNLHLLELSYNPIGEGGAKALANGLHSLHFLGLRKANIGVGGTDAIAFALRMENNLRELSLPNNNIGTTGATSLASMLADNDHLQRLDISYNNIGFDGTKALVSALEHNDALETLEVAGIDCGYDGCNALKELSEKKSASFEVIWATLEMGEEGCVNFCL